MTIERDLRPGDILVASDNLFQIPNGYWGHAAMMLNETEVIEATDTFPYIRIIPWQTFAEDHPVHAQFRPKRADVGLHAASCAADYHMKYRENIEQGIEAPVFSFFGPAALNDPWETIYCSKLVWLSYNYGANITFHNDFFLFTPEDLDTQLRQDDRFELIYQHPKFFFRIDT